MSRPLVEQQFTQFPLTVGTTATTISSSNDLASMIDTFIITVPAAAANAVYFGNESVLTTNGIELSSGNSYIFGTDNTRQLYELENPLIGMSSFVQGRSIPGVTLPFVCWNLSRCFLIATAGTDVRIIVFRNPFI